MSKRELIVTPHHDGRARTVVVEGPGADGRFRIAIDGCSHDVDGREIRPGTWSLLFDGRSVVVDLDKPRSAEGTVVASVGSGQVALEIDPTPHSLGGSAAHPSRAGVIEHASRQKLSGGRTNPTSGEALRAPIAGKVVKVSIAVGDVVAPHTPVIAIEAMKMENELVCERGGTVTAIHKHVGQAVETGELLVELV